MCTLVFPLLLSFVFLRIGSLLLYWFILGKVSLSARSVGFCDCRIVVCCQTLWNCVICGVYYRFAFASHCSAIQSSRIVIQAYTYRVQTQALASKLSLTRDCDHNTTHCTSSGSSQHTCWCFVFCNIIYIQVHSTTSIVVAHTVLCSQLSATFGLRLCHSRNPFLACNTSWSTCCELRSLRTEIFSRNLHWLPFFVYSFRPLDFTCLVLGCSLSCL